MDFDPEKWAVWHYRATIVNDGANSGSHTYDISPGAGNVGILLGGQFLNGDAAGRTCQVFARDTDDNRFRSLLPNTTVAAGARREFPTSEATGDNNPATGGSPVMIAGTESVFVSVLAVAVSQDSEMSVQFLVSAGPPSVTLTSPTGATETVTEDRIV